jgi:signal peptidase I
MHDDDSGREETSVMKRRIREYLPLVLVALCLLAARSSLADHYIVPSGSMERTLLPGDRVIVDKRAYGLRVPFTLTKLTAGSHPARGDIVIFDSPADHLRLIKRIVAVGGDVLMVRNGHVFINGVSQAEAGNPSMERFAGHDVALDLEFGGGPDLPPTRVPAGEVFVMGDARGNSKDSRFFGFVHEHEIYARALRVYFRSGNGFVWKPL